MAVQQGKLGATDTTVNMEDFYSDAVVIKLSDVDRIIENGLQIHRLVIQRPQANFSRSGNSSTPTMTIDAPQYIDGVFTPNPTAGTNLILIGFGTQVPTAEIVLYSTTFIDPTLAGWTVSTSLNNLASEFSNSNFEASISSVNQAIDGGTGQFKYTVDVTAPAVDTTGEGLPYWRIVHSGTNSFDDVTEVQIIEPLTPTISIFETDGDLASSVTFEEENILDACFSTPDDVFFTIRFNDSGVGTTALGPSDDFSEASAGAAAGSNDFNPARWDESTENSRFLRQSEELVYNVATGKGQLETTYALADNYQVEIDVSPVSLTTEPMWFSIRLLDSSNRVVASEGIGIETSPTSSGVFFATFIDNISNLTSSSQFREARPLWHNTASGTDSFEIIFQGATWSVSGTQTGALTNATTGVPYTESIDTNTPLEFLISSSATPSVGEKFTFDLITHNTKKPPLSGGTLGVTVTGGFHITNNVLTTLATYPIPSEALSVELFGNTNGSISLTGDDYVVTTTGEAIFPDIAVFTVEKVDADGLVVGSPLIEAFDIVGDPSKTYNDFLEGRVQIACSSSGTAGGGYIYIKVDNVLYKYPNSIALTSEDGTSATVSTTAEIEQDGTNSLAWTREPSINGLPFLTYVEYDETLDLVNLKTIDESTLLNTSTDKKIFLDISDYGTNRYEIFYDQSAGQGFTTIYYVDSSFNLQAFDVDDRISAFMAVNAEDVTLPAGTSQQTFVNADVINAWGEALDGKDVTFTVTAGDGAVSPSTDTTISGGRATTQFTVGSTVGTSTVTATVTET